MKKSDKNIKTKLFIRFLAPYILILCIPLSLNLVYSRYAMDVVEKNSQESSLSQLNQSKMIMDNHLQEIVRIIEQMKSNPYVTRFTYVKRPYEDNIGALFDVNKALYNYRLTSNFIAQFFMLFKNSGIALSTNTLCDFKTFYTRVLSYPQWNYGQWRETFFEQYHNKRYLPEQEVTFRGKASSMITCLDTMGRFGKKEGVFVILIDSGKITRLLSDGHADGGWAFILDRDGTVIHQISAAEESIPEIGDISFSGMEGASFVNLDGNSMYLTYTTSSYNGWRYVKIQPVLSVMGELTNMRRLTLYILLGSLFVGLVVAAFVAHRNSKPLSMLVNEMLAGMGENDPSGINNVFVLIQRYFDRLIHNYEALNTTMLRQLPILQEHLLMKLVNGQFTTIGEILLQAKRAELRLDGKMFAVVACAFGGYKAPLTESMLKEMEIIRVVMKDTAKRLFGDGLYLYMDQERITIIVQSDETDQQRAKAGFEEMLEKLRLNMPDNLRTDFLFVLGSLCEDISDIPISHMEASRFMNFALAGGKRGVLWSVENADGAALFYYPKEIEARLMSSVRAGNEEEVSKLLQQITVENFTYRQLSAQMLNILMHVMLGTLMRLLNELANDTPLQKDTLYQVSQWSGTGNAPRFQDMISYTYKRLCEHVEAQKKSHNVALASQMRAFVEAHCTSPELSLNQVADRFNITMVYASHFFKEQTGENFSAYLERLRIEKAKRMLENSNALIHDVAKKVGYNSVNSFCRAFRRVTNKNATKYRDS